MGTVGSNAHMLEYLKSSYLIFNSGEIVFPPDVSWELRGAAVISAGGYRSLFSAPTSTLLFRFNFQEVDHNCGCFSQECIQVI